MKISIITPVKNGAKTIEKCLQSVKEQSNENSEFSTEHLILDGGSSDKTKEIVFNYRYDGLKYISSNDTGIYDAYNQGIKQATGDVIGCIGADDYYLPGTCLNVFQFFKQHPEVGIYSGAIEVSSGRIVQPWRGIADLGGARIFHPTTFFRSSLFESVGYFDTKYKIVSDLDFFLRCKKQGVVFEITKKPLTHFGLGGTSSNSKSTIKELSKAMIQHKIPFLNRLFILIEEYLRWLVR